MLYYFKLYYMSILQPTTELASNIERQEERIKQELADFVVRELSPKQDKPTEPDYKRLAAIFQFVENSPENATLSKEEEEQKIQLATGMSLTKLQEIKEEIGELKQKLNLNGKNMNILGGSYFESEIVAVVGELWLADFTVKPYYSNFIGSIYALDNVLNQGNFEQKTIVTAFLQQSLKSYLELVKSQNFTKELEETLSLPEFYDKPEFYAKKCNSDKLRIINSILIKKVRELGPQPEETKFYGELGESSKRSLQKALDQAADLALSLIRPAQSELEARRWNINSLGQQKAQVMKSYQKTLKTDFQNLATPAIKIPDNSREAHEKARNRKYESLVPNLIKDFNNGQNPKYGWPIDVKLVNSKLELETPRRSGLLQYTTGHSILVYLSNLEESEENKLKQKSNINSGSFQLSYLCRI
jgi:hypothetical protein